MMFLSAFQPPTLNEIDLGRNAMFSCTTIDTPAKEGGARVECYFPYTTYRRGVLPVIRL